MLYLLFQEVKSLSLNLLLLYPKGVMMEIHGYYD